MRVPFFRVAERKEPKKGRPHCLRPLRFAPGQPAVLGPACAARGARARETRPSAAKARMDVGCSAVRMSHPCWLRLRRGGCGVSMGVEAPMPRELTRRGCMNEAAPQRSEFHGAPRNRPDAGLPLRSAKGSQTGGRLSFGYFSLAKQRKVPRPPGRLPASALNKGTPANQRRQPSTTKSIATSAYPASACSQNHPKTPDTSLITRSHRAASDSSCVTITNAVP